MAVGPRTYKLEWYPVSGGIRSIEIIENVNGTDPNIPDRILDNTTIFDVVACLNVLDNTLGDPDYVYVTEPRSPVAIP